ncbi:MAG: carbon-phosphorus lyase complex subunit PhnI [Thermodesulfobacteriota bacterium]|nr:carbon-phosphorus lyase complex subunit PhnI [Thermodesulfobacteriota bacterium]
MSYVAIKGGTQAIRSSKRFFRDFISPVKGINDHELQQGLIFACDRIMGEGALYSEHLAAEALRRTGGDLLEAAFYLRAHRSTCRRIGDAEQLRTDSMRVLRRISSTFKDIEGGQILGPSCDYVIRLFRARVEDNEILCDAPPVSGPIPSALDSMRRRDQIMVLENSETAPFDVSRSFPLPPYPRSALMQVMARGETGSMLGFAYTSMRGYGDVHPTIGDLRIGYLTVEFTHPFTGKRIKIGEIRVTGCETVGSFNRDPKDGKLRLSTGFGFCLGFNETKAIAMSILDLAMHHSGYSVGGVDIAANPEIVIHHVDGIESMGFANHFKLPHYVTFQADLQVLDKAKEMADG